MKKVIILLLFSIMALGLSAQTPINTQTGIVPVHNLRVEDTTYFGQLIGIWAIDAGDTMFGFVPVYVLPDSTLLVGSDTVYSSGNPQVITLSGDVTGSGTSSIVTNIAAGAVGATELQIGAVTTVKIAASAVDSTKIGTNAVGPSELQSTAVTPGSYTLSSMTVDADGRLTAASSGTVNLASQVTGTLPVANGGTGATSLSGAGIATTATGTTNYIPKYTAATVLGQSQIFDNGTNVGIGTTTPADKLHISGNLQFSNTGNTSNSFGLRYTSGYVPDVIKVTSSGSVSKFGFFGAAGQEFVLTLDSNNVSVFKNYRIIYGTDIIYQINRFGRYMFNYGTNGATYSDTRLAVFDNSNIPQIRISYNISTNKTDLQQTSAGNLAILPLGNVGIGNTSPSQRLHVTGNIFSDGTNAQFLGDDAVNAVTTPTYSFSGDTDNGMYRPAADNIGLVTNGTEKLRITSAGNVGIGTTSPTNHLDVNGSARIRTFTGTPKRIIGADLSGVLDTLVLGSGLSITSGTLNTTNNGTVSSVGLTMPSGFTVSNSPVTTSGTLAVTTTLNGPLRGNGSGFTTGNTNLASEVTGTLPVANGGTGVTTLTANKVLVGNGTSTVLSPTNLHWDNTNSRLGISETSPAYPLDINAITAIRLPRGTDGQQPAAAAGLFRFSTTTNTVDWSDGTNWYKGISGEGQGPSSSFNRIALWSGASTQTSDADLTFNPSTGQLKMLKYTSASTFTGTSVAELHVTSTGEVITKTPRDTQYVFLVAVNPGTTVTQTAGTAFHQSTWLVPEHLKGYQVTRTDYALTNCTSTSGSLSVGLSQYNNTNALVSGNQCSVNFNGSTTEVRDSSTGFFTLSERQWIRVEVDPNTSGTLNNTVQGLLVTIMLTK